MRLLHNLVYNNSVDGSKAPILSSTLDAYIIACNIYVERHAATVNVKTNQLLALSPPLAPILPLEWEAWTAPKEDNKWDIWALPAIGQYNHYHSKWVSEALLLIMIFAC